MKTIYIATKNKHKIKEIQDILDDININAQPFPNFANIAETGTTFEENAAIKALKLSLLTQEFVIADDSGLELDALGGAPGVHSARYAGVHGDDKGNNAKLLQDMEGVDDRRCRFVCVIALAKEGAVIKTFRGEIQGTLGHKEEGENGFGYDPLFVTNSGQTMAQLTKNEKNDISHRRLAVEKLKIFLKHMEN